MLPLKSSGKTDSLRIGLKLDLFSGLLRRSILSDSPQTYISKVVSKFTDGLILLLFFAVGEREGSAGERRGERRDFGAAEGAGREEDEGARGHPHAGTNCIQIGLPGKSIFSKRKGLWEVIFS